jgi:hypothetical protein
MMQTKREYLVTLGLAKAGRGKFSNAAKEALVKAEKEGIVFSEPNPVKPVKVKPAPKATGPVEAPKPAPVKSAGTGLVDYLYASDYRYPEAEYKAVEVGGKKVHGMRECCNTCRVSLTNHMCDNPTILGNIAVKIVPA